jgi:citrate synthase
MTGSNGDKEWRTAIAEATDDGVRVRGYDVLADLTGKIGFDEMVYLLFKGELPSPGQAKMITAVFVACADHGISPSSTVSRYLQAAGIPIQCAVAGGIMMFGDIHGGAGEQFCRDVQELVRRANAEDRDYDEAAEAFVKQHKRLDGFGHPQHRSGDPRTPVLFDLAHKYGVAGDHIRMTGALERALERKVGRRIAANIDAAVGAIVADLGFDWRLARALIAIPRTAGLFAHCHEEMEREPGWRQVTLDQIDYDGTPPRRLDR